MSLLFNMLCRLVITFLPRSKHLGSFPFTLQVSTQLSQYRKPSLTSSYLRCMSLLQNPTVSLFTHLVTLHCPWNPYVSSVQLIRSVMSDSLRPHRSMPGRPVHHQLPEITQTHVHWVGDAIQSSHSLSSPSPTAFSLSHQGLFKWVSSSHQVAKGLEFQLEHQSFQWTPRTDLL